MAINSPTTRVSAPTTPTPAGSVVPPAGAAPMVPNTPQGLVVNSGSDQPSSGGSKKTVIIISIILVVLIVSAVLLLGVVKKPFAGLATDTGGEEFEVAAGEAALAELRDSAGTSVDALRNGQEYEVDVFAGVDALNSFIFAVTMPVGVSVGPIGSAFSTSGFETRETFIDGKFYVYGIASSAVALDGGRLGTLHLISQSDVDADEIQIEFSALDDAEEELIRTTTSLKIGEADAPDIGCDRPCDFEGGQCLGNLRIQFCRDRCIVPDEGQTCIEGTMCNRETASCEPDGDNDGKLDAEDNCRDRSNPDQIDTDDDGIGDVCDNTEDLQAEVDLDNRGASCDQSCNFVGKRCLGNLRIQFCRNGCIVPDEEVPVNERTCTSGTMCNPATASCEDDRDNDMTFDAVDNCIDDLNVDQLDTDEDGLGDACDADKDNDDIANAEDQCPLDATNVCDSQDLRGDVNGDEQINILDAMKIVDFINGPESNLANPEMNIDCKEAINILDAMAIVDFINDPASDHIVGIRCEDI